MSAQGLPFPDAGIAAYPTLVQEMETADVQIFLRSNAGLLDARSP